MESNEFIIFSDSVLDPPVKFLPGSTGAFFEKWLIIKTKFRTLQ